MQEEEVISKAKVLLEALPYIQQFKGSTFVVKYGGSFMDDPDPELRSRVARDIVLLAAVGIHVVVVHGGGKAISRAMEEAGLAPLFVNGLRVTDEAAIKVVEKTLNQVINKDICSLIEEQQGRSLGLPGNNVFVCRKLAAADVEGRNVDHGFVGEIDSVKTGLIESAIAGGYTPVISPIAVDADGNPYNTNADVAASHVAMALKARRLVYLSDVPGLLRDPRDAGSIVSTLHIDEVGELKRSGVISTGMLPKVDSAVKAIGNGVHRVHFVDARMPHSILLEIFTDKGIGTEIVNS